MATVTVLTSCSHATHRVVGHQPAVADASNAAPVAWVDRAAPAPTNANAPPPTAKYAPCSAAQLTAADGPQGEDGDRYIKLTNTSGHPCTLEGMPAHAVGVAADGSVHAVDTRPTDAMIVLPANVEPGYSGFVIIGSTNECPRPSRSTLSDLAFDVPGGGRVHLQFPAGELFPLGCGVGMGAIGLLNSHEPASPIDRLDATARMPVTLAAGEPARYSVTLHNPTDSVIRLAPCPAYVEYLESSPFADSAIKRYYLNCDEAMGGIPPHGSVTFDMRIPTPTVTGRARWGWALINSDVEVRGNVTITRR